MSNITKWPENIQTRSAEEWANLAATWSDADSRTAIVDALKALKVPATEYARKQPPERVAMIVELQEKLVPGSTKGKPAGAPAAATGAAAAGAKKAAAPKAAGTGTAAAATGGGGGNVDLSPVYARLDATDAKLDSLAVTAGNIETLLKLLLLNPANADSLQLAADPDVLAEFAGKSIGELAGGNG